MWVGPKVGTSVGITEGWCVVGPGGLRPVHGVGSAVGGFVSFVDGCSVGVGDGTAVGSSVGASVGISVGHAVVGLSVGPNVGR